MNVHAPMAAMPKPIPTSGDETLEMAQADTMLSPRFYTTDMPRWTGLT